MVGEPIYPGSWVEVRGQAHQFSPKWKQFYTCKNKTKKSARTYRRENSDISRNISPFPNVAFISPVFGQFLLGTSEPATPWRTFCPPSSLLLWW